MSTESKNSTSELPSTDSGIINKLEALSTNVSVLTAAEEERKKNTYDPSRRRDDFIKTRLIDLNIESAIAGMSKPANGTEKAMVNHYISIMSRAIIDTLVILDIGTPKYHTLLSGGLRSFSEGGVMPSDSFYVRLLASNVVRDLHTQDVKDDIDSRLACLCAGMVRAISDLSIFKAGLIAKIKETIDADGGHIKPTKVFTVFNEEYRAAMSFIRDYIEGKITPDKQQVIAAFCWYEFSKGGDPYGFGSDYSEMYYHS